MLVKLLSSFNLNMDQQALTFSQYFYNYAASITGILSVILLGIAFVYQNKQLKIAKSSLAKAELDSDRKQFEDNFYFFLKIYRDNVKDMTSLKGGSGREVFVSIKNEFEKIFELVSDYLAKRKPVKDEAKLDQTDIIKISYTILFFGVGDNSDPQASTALKPYAKLLPGLNKLIRESKPESKFLFDGHQSRLGHYFRHLFQTVTFVHETNLLKTQVQRDFYMRRLRGQLSTFELSVLFLNSFANFGKIWRAYICNNQQPVDLITKYDLIKNIPSGFFTAINHKEYFPNVHYEEDLVE